MYSWGTVEDVLVTAPGILKFALAYAEANRAFELHLHQYGEHGLALSNYVLQGHTDGNPFTEVDLLHYSQSYKRFKLIFL